MSKLIPGTVNPSSQGIDDFQPVENPGADYAIIEESCAVQSFNPVLTFACCHLPYWWSVSLPTLAKVIVGIASILCSTTDLCTVLLNCISLLSTGIPKFHKFGFLLLLCNCCNQNKVSYSKYSPGKFLSTHYTTTVESCYGQKNWT